MSGRSYNVAGMGAVLSGRTRAGVLTIWQACVQRGAGTREQVFLQFGKHACSAERAPERVFLPFGRQCSAVAQEILNPTI